MGFDLSGLNPKMNMEPDDVPFYTELNKTSFTFRYKLFELSEDIKEKYYKDMDAWEDSNPGVYFRNNVWWWRPLWQFVCERFDDILTEKDMEHGSYNDGHEISADKAMKIGIELTSMLKSGRIKEYSDRYEADMKALPKVVCNRCNGNNHGNRKKKDCNPCNKTGERDDWATSYPFDVRNVEEFAKFCLESGGFSIC